MCKKETQKRDLPFVTSLEVSPPLLFEPESVSVKKSLQTRMIEDTHHR